MILFRVSDRKEYKHVKKNSNVLYNSLNLKGLSRHYYKTHQRRHRERVLVSIAHRWLLYE